MSESDKQLPGMKCGECVFYKTFPKGKVSCSKEGIRAFANADMSCFVPDVSQITSNTEQLAALLAVMNSFSAKQLKMCHYLLEQQAKRTAKQLPMGTKVYVLSGDDYLLNYLSAYVMHYLPDGTLVVSGSSKMNCRGKTFIGYLNPESVLSSLEWDKKRAALIKAGRITDPAIKEVKQYSEVDHYEPDVPTIDNVPEEWLTRQEKPTKKHRDAFDRLAEYL